MKKIVSFIVLFSFVLIHGNNDLGMYFKNAKGKFALSLKEACYQSEARRETSLTLLHDACIYQNLGIAKECLRAGYNPNEKDVCLNDTALHIASRKGNLELMKMIIKYGPDFYAINDYNKTPEETYLDYLKFINNPRKNSVFDSKKV